MFKSEKFITVSLFILLVVVATIAYPFIYTVLIGDYSGPMMHLFNLEEDSNVVGALLDLHDALTN